MNKIIETSTFNLSVHLSCYLYPKQRQSSFKKTVFQKNIDFFTFFAVYESKKLKLRTIPISFTPESGSWRSYKHFKCSVAIVSGPVFEIFHFKGVKNGPENSRFSSKHVNLFTKSVIFYVFWVAELESAVKFNLKIHFLVTLAVFSNFTFLLKNGHFIHAFI